MRNLAIVAAGSGSVVFLASVVAPIIWRKIQALWICKLIIYFVNAVIS